MWKQPASSRLLGEYRGLPEVKSGELSLILQALGTIALLHPEIAEIDINPVMIRGADPVAADALVGLKAEDRRLKTEGRRFG